MKKLRVISICIFRHAGKILAAAGHDNRTNENFFRPFGGGVEFGESSLVALRREILEELGQAIESPVLLGVLENIFQFDGTTGHEIVFVYDAAFQDSKQYALDQVLGIEAGKRTRLIGSWLDVTDVLAQNCKVYPRGIELFL